MAKSKVELLDIIKSDIPEFNDFVELFSKITKKNMNYFFSLSQLVINFNLTSTLMLNKDGNGEQCEFIRGRKRCTFVVQMPFTEEEKGWLWGTTFVDNHEKGARMLVMNTVDVIRKLCEEHDVRYETTGINWDKSIDIKLPKLTYRITTKSIKIPVHWGDVVVRADKDLIHIEKI